MSITFALFESSVERIGQNKGHHKKEPLNPKPYHKLQCTVTILIRADFRLQDLQLVAPCKPLTST